MLHLCLLQHCMQDRYYIYSGLHLVCLDRCCIYSGLHLVCLDRCCIGFWLLWMLDTSGLSLQFRCSI